MKRSQNNFTRSSSNKPYNNFKNTARLTNSVNLTAFRAFNNWGGMSNADILSTYPPHLIEKAWNYLAREVIENYQMGKGTFIKGFGTFTFTDVEFSLEGTTNQYSRDIKRRRTHHRSPPEISPAPSTATNTIALNTLVFSISLFHLFSGFTESSLS